MPRIPLAPQPSPISGAGLGPGPTGNQGEVALGQALRDVARDATSRKVDQIAQSWELADTVAKTLGELETFKQGLASDDDYDGHGPRYVAKAKEIEDRVKEQFGKNTLLFQTWQRDFRQAATAGEMQVAIDAQKLKAERVRVDLGNQMEALANLTGVSETQDRVVRSQALLAIEQNRQLGNIDYAERDRLIHQFDSATDETTLRRDMTADPIGTEARLLSDPNAYPRVTGERRARWQQTVSAAAEREERRALADEEHRMRVAEHQQKLAGDAAAKELDSLPPGQLTAAAIEERREVLSEEDYRYFYREMRNPSGSESAPGNVPLYADLRERAGRGEDVRDEARTALQRGSIRTSDYDRIVGEVEQSRPGWRRLGSDYLSTVSGYSDLNPTPGAAQLKAAMLDEWGQWADQHPNATPDEARKMYIAIGESHQLADEAVKVLTFPMPTFATGDRQQMLDPSVLNATAARTKQALDAGEITQDEYNRQAAIWKQWSDLARNSKKAPQ